jgi:hypothetical protein
MNRKDREFLREESGRRFESMLRRFSEVQEVIPWLRPGLSCSALRRTAARLRAGKIRSIDSRIPSHVLAEAIEESIAQELLVKSVTMEMLELREMRRELKEKYEAERARHIVAGFHRLKKSPEASNPESPVAQNVRRMHRVLRNALGRPRKRRKGK